MLALKITDVKEFMNQLLTKETFDSFCMIESSVTTFNTFFIDGKLNPDFFDTDERDVFQRHALTHSFWKDIRPFCYSVIRGKRVPLSFKIILALSPRQQHSLLQNISPATVCGQINGMYLNIQYKNHTLLLTTGISLNTFPPDKLLEQAWDSTVRSFLKNHQLPFEEI